MATHQLDDDVLTEVERALEHFNGNHADTMLFLARFGAGCHGADDAEATSVDAHGIDLTARVCGAERSVRVAFDGPATTMPAIRRELLGTVTAARSVAGDGVPLTSLERELRNRPTLPTFVTHVAAVRDLSSNVREIELEGGLDGFGSIGGDQFVFVFVPRPGGPPIPDGYTMAAHLGADQATAPFGAYYTVRAWDRARGRLTLWMVLHGHADGVAAWASTCRIGDRVAVWGPREGFGARPDASRHLLVADESGLAAVAALLDELPADARGDAIVEVVDARHEIALPHRPGITVTWLHRGAAEPGTGTGLLDAVTWLELDPDGLVAFGAAESRQVTAIRAHLRRVLGMPSRDVYMTGYWRRTER